MAQKSDPVKGDWFFLVSDDLDLLNLNMTEEEIHNETT